VRSPVRFEDQQAFLPKAEQKLLGVKKGDRLNMIPFE
jgi:hypothetical protein